MSFIHPNAIVETDVGKKTRVWAFAHILEGAKVGNDCNICDHVFIEGGVTIGDRVTVKSGVQLWEGVTIEDDVFIGPNATFTNDPFPRSKQKPPEFTKTLVQAGASVGANATILPGLVVGFRAMIGAGAVVTRDVPPHAVVAGNPARILGYTDSLPSEQNGHAPDDVMPRDLQTGGARLLELPSFRDLRGSLAVGELDTQFLPFAPQRFFVVHSVPGREVRGAHAHRQCHQLLVCVSGSCCVLVDDGANRTVVELTQPSHALYIPPNVWAVQYNYSTSAALLVLASHKYDPADYIRSYADFREAVKVG